MNSDQIMNFSLTTAKASEIATKRWEQEMHLNDTWKQTFSNKHGSWKIGDDQFEGTS